MEKVTDRLKDKPGTSEQMKRESGTGEGGETRAQYLKRLGLPEFTNSNAPQGTPQTGRAAGE